MKAIVVHDYGPPDVLMLEEVPIPVPGAGEVLVQVRAAGVGPWDALVRTGTSGIPQKLPLTPGSDICGSVHVCGPGVTQLSNGDDVFGATNPSFTGGYAEYAIARTGMLARKPHSLDDVTAAGIPVIAVTAKQMLFDYARAEPGQTILIHGGGGSVGSFAVQLAKHAGIRTIATASAHDLDFVRSLGADEAIDYAAVPFERAVSVVDAVLDTIGGATLQRSFAVVKRGGVIVSSAGEPSQDEAARRGVRATFFIVDVTTARLNEIAALFDLGVLHARIGDVLPLADARAAHFMLAGKKHKPGKIVLRV
jgi:NADPH:quinone reductase-like Zn-dependent oxidoreductase